MKVSLSFFKSVSQFYNLLIVSQMLRIDETFPCIIYRERFHRRTRTAFSVSQFLPVAVPVPDSEFRIPDFLIIRT